MASVMLYHYIYCVSLLMDLFVLSVACLTVFVNCWVKQSALVLVWMEVLFGYTMYGLPKSV